MSQIEKIEANISALIDGELSRDDLLKSIDMILENGDARRFYNEARALESLVSRHRETDPMHEELPNGLWDKIEKEYRQPEAKVVRLGGVFTKVWAAAAAILIAVGIWAGVWQLPQATALPQPVNITLSENKGEMTEKRFVELASELLQADRSYHRKMLEVMQTVTEGNFVAEGSLEGVPTENQTLASADNPDQTISETDKATTSERNQRTGGSPVQISLW